jgi:hypothetical protein
MKKGVGSGVKFVSGSGAGSIRQRYGSADPDPHQNVTDPQHCVSYLFWLGCLLVASQCWAVGICEYTNFHVAGRSYF